MSIRVRAYNVLFGDSLLVSWDEADGPHHAWIDFGNFVNDPNAVFSTVYSDVLAETGGKVDLLVATHRHMDHMEGFYCWLDSIARDFKIKKVWYAHVTKGLDDQFTLAEQQIRERSLLPAWVQNGEGVLGQIYRNNFGVQGITVEDRMDAIIKKLRPTPSHAVYRGMNMTDVLPDGIKHLQIEILAPEKDSSAYFEPLEQALAMRVEMDDHFRKFGLRAKQVPDGLPFHREKGKQGKGAPLDWLADFSRLRRKLRSGGLDLLGAVDKTRNNTSVVLALTYGQTRLLFAGDAEEKSWELMQKKGADFESTMIKVAHHGSINASPPWSYAKVFPASAASNGVIISTDPTRYTGENEVPKEEVVENWQGRVVNVGDFFKRTDTVGLGEHVEIKYD